jgi:hypothetical protein
MAISRFDKPAGLPPIDFDFLFKTKQYNDKLNKEAADDVDALSTKLSSVNALPQDKALRNQKLNAYDQKLKSWTDKYQNNMSAGLSELRTIKNDFYKDMTRGQLAAVQSNYNARAEHEKEVDKAFYDGKINQQRRDALLNYDLHSYKGVGEESPEGQYNSYQGSTPAREVDIAKMVDDRLSGWKADKVARGGYKSYGSDEKGIYFINNKNAKEYANPKEMESVIRPVLEQNPEVKSFIDQEVKFQTMGIDPNESYQMTDASGKPITISGQDAINHYKQSYINNAVNYGTAKHGFMQTESGQSDLSFAPESWGAAAKEQQAQNTTGLYAPSTASPYNSYWEREKSGLEASSKLGSALSFGLTSPLPFLTGFAAGWQIGGTGKEYTAKQESDLKKAQNMFGNYASDKKAQNKTLDKFYSYMGDQMQNIPWQFPATKDGNVNTKAANDKAAELNNFYFGSPDKPSGSTINTNVAWKEVGGNNKTLTAEELKKKVGSDKVHFKWMGSLPDDNFYFPAGEGFEAVDDQGNVLGRFVTESANSNRYKTGWEFYQSKMGEDIKLSQFPDYTVSYKRGLHPTELDNEGFPIRDFTNDVVVIKDKHGNVVMQSDKGTADPVADVYNKFSNAVNSGTVK